MPTDLRPLVAHVAAHIGPASDPALHAAWDALVAGLDLGPAPETRACPACGRTIRVAARLCGYCWANTERAGGAP